MTLDTLFQNVLVPLLKQLDEQLNSDLPEGCRIDVDARGALKTGKVEILVHTPDGNTHQLTLPELGKAVCLYYKAVGLTQQVEEETEEEEETPEVPEPRTLEDRLYAIERHLGL